MSRIPRIVIPGLPHHVTQRGNRKQVTFFCDDDYETYIRFMARSCRDQKVEIWAYCLMPNHVHLIAVPSKEEGLKLAIGEAHRRYTRRINLREGWRGYLWQGRFFSSVMDEQYLVAAARYIELNPVRAGLAREPWLYRWSSARAHVRGKDELLVGVSPLIDIVGDWKWLLTRDAPEDQMPELREKLRSGRPLGSDEFTARIEQLSGYTLRSQKRGPKPKQASREHIVSAPQTNLP